MSISKSLKAFICLSLCLLIQNPTYAVEDADLEEYMIRSISLRKMESLIDLIHISCFNKKKEVIEHTIDQKNIWFSGGGSVTLDVHYSEEMNSRYRDLDGTEFVHHFVEDFNLSSDLHQPLTVSSIQFHPVVEKGSHRSMKMTGIIDFNGTFGEEGVTNSYPFTAQFSITGRKELLDSHFISLEAGSLMPAPPRKHDFHPWKLHEDEDFLAPYVSPLIIQGYCTYGEFEEVIRPLLKMQEDHDWLTDRAIYQKWSKIRAVESRKEASVAITELFTSFPYFLPTGHQRKLNGHRYNTGDDQIEVLLHELEINPYDLDEKVTSVTSQIDSKYDETRIQAYLTRAWMYLLYDEADQGWFNKDLDKSRSYPFIREIELISFLGNASSGRFQEAQESLDRYHRIGKNSVMDYFMRTTYSDTWYEYGKKMDSFYSHEEALLGYFIGNQFQVDEIRLRALSNKASRMGNQEISKIYLEQLLQSQLNEKNPDLWLDLAMIKSELGENPENEIYKSSDLKGDLSPLSYCSKAKFYHNTGHLDVAQKELKDGSLRWKKNADIFRTKAIIDPDIRAKKKYYLRSLKYSNDETKERLFKKGVLHHTLADSAFGLANQTKKRELFKDCIYYYKRAVRKGFSGSLGYKRIAQAYVSLDNLEEAAYYYSLAIENQDQSSSVHFAQSLLRLAVNDIEEFKSSLKLAEENGFLSSANERDSYLFSFLKNIHDFDELILIASDRKLKWGERQADMQHWLETIDERTKELEVNGDDRSAAYAAYSRMLFDSVEGYINREETDKKDDYSGKNLVNEGVVKTMIEKSDIEPEFLKKLRFMKSVNKWNDEMKSSIYPEIPNPKKKTMVNYLKQSKTFKDSYNYL